MPRDLADIRHGRSETRATKCLKNGRHETLALAASEIFVLADWARKQDRTKIEFRGVIGAMIADDEMLVTLRDVTSRFDELGVAYMVTGSFAMSTYTTARTTLDIDVVIEMIGIDAEEFEAKFRGEYYVNSNSVNRAISHQSMFNMLSNTTGLKIDCIVRKDDKFEVEKFARRRRARLGGVEFWVISKNDLILSKLRWAKDSHSELQFCDISKLLESGVSEDEVAQQVQMEGTGRGLERFSGMEDTSEEIKAMQHAYWMALPEEERFRRCGALFSLAKKAAEERAPSGLTAEEKKWFVIGELYGSEFVKTMRDNNE